MEESPDTTEQLVEVPAEPTPPEEIAVDPHECQYPDGLEHCIICGKPIEKDAPPQAEIVSETPIDTEVPVPPTEGVANEGTTTPTPEGVAIPTETVAVEEPKVEEKVAEPSNPVGRPSKYKDDFPQLLLEHMKKGYSYEAFAADAEVNIDTLYEWEKVHPEFSDAKSHGKAQSLKFWEALGIGGVVGNIEGFNTTAWIFNMKNRHKWSDRNEIVGNDGAPLSMVIDIVRQKQETTSE